jgi:hypothetical protein
VAPGSKTISIVAASVTDGVGTVTSAAPHGFSPNEVVTFGAVSGTAGAFPALLSGLTVTILSITSTTFSFEVDSDDSEELEITTSAIFVSTGMSYATVEVVADLDFPGAGRTFHLDKVVFRE